MERQLSKTDVPASELATRRAALFSVYYHTYERGGGARLLLPERLRPMRLEDAVDAIHPADQRLALAKLVAAGGLVNRHGLCELTSKFFSKTIPGHSVHALKTNVLSQPSLAPHSPDYSAVVHNILLGTTAKAEPGPKYEKTVTQTDVDFDVNTLVSKATTTIEVKRDLKGLAAVMDPISWRTLGPDTFAYSYKVKVDDKGQVVSGPDGRPQEDTRAPGSSWNGLLYEEFVWSWNQASLCRYRNLLNIDFAVTGSSIQLKYGLSECLNTRVGIDEQAGGLDVDSGDASVVSDPNDSTKLLVKATKNIRFTDRTPGDVGLETPLDLGMTLNYLAPALVGIFLDRAVSMAVCARLPS